MGPVHCSARCRLWIYREDRARGELDPGLAKARGRFGRTPDIDRAECSAGLPEGNAGRFSRNGKVRGL